MRLRAALEAAAAGRAVKQAHGAAHGGAYDPEFTEGRGLIQVTTGSQAPPGAVILNTNVISELMRAAPNVHVEGWVREVPPAMV